MKTTECFDLESYEKNVLSSPAFKEQRALEYSIARKNNSKEVYALPGFCTVCDRSVEFIVDRKLGAERLSDGTWLANWREQLACSSCGLNNRLRAIAEAIGDFIQNHPPLSGNPAVYMTEQLSPTYERFKIKFPGITCTGSEYLGPELVSGSIRNGIRHENIESLSFQSSMVDLIISNDVLEHVNDPLKALREMARVLRPGGAVLLTVPIQHHRNNDVRRARLLDGRVEHILPPLFHANPLSPDGSIVYVDFGWNLLRSILDSGFSKVSAKVYWSEEYGYLGRDQMYFHATK